MEGRSISLLPRVKGGRGEGKNPVVLPRENANARDENRSPTAGGASRVSFNFSSLIYSHTASLPLYNL